MSKSVACAIARSAALKAIAPLGQRDAIALLVALSGVLLACDKPQTIRDDATPSTQRDCPKGAARCDRTASPNTTTSSTTAIPIGVAFSQTSNYALLGQESVIGASNTAKGIPEIGDYIARVSAPVSQVAPNAIKAALKLNPKIKKVAVFYAQNMNANGTNGKFTFTK